MCDTHLISLHLCFRPAVSLFSVTEPLARVSMSSVISLLIHSSIQIQRCNLNNQYQTDGTGSPPEFRVKYVTTAERRLICPCSSVPSISGGQKLFLGARCNIHHHGCSYHLNKNPQHSSNLLIHLIWQDMTLTGNPVGGSVANHPVRQQAPSVMSSSSTDVHCTTVTTYK